MGGEGGAVVKEAHDCRSAGGDGLDEYEEDEGLTSWGGESRAAKRGRGSRARIPI